MVKYLYGLLLIFLPLALAAQEFTPDPDWRFENFNSQNHFISRGITDLAVDKHGYVWTCSDGVQRFDGYKTTEFTSFTHTDGSLRANYTSLKADYTGRVWFCSSGICYFDDATGKFIYLKTDRKHNITNVNSYCLKDNYLWFVCDFGLAKLDLKSLKISNTSLSCIIDPLCSYAVNDSTLLVTSREKIYFYNIKQDNYQTQTLIYKNTLVKVFQVIKQDSHIFLGTDQGLFSFDDLKNVLPVCDETRGVPVDDMTFMPADKQRKFLFVATEGKGIVAYNTVSKKTELSYVHNDNNPYSIPNNIITRFFIDRTNRLWLSSGVGISMLDINHQQVKMRFLNQNGTEGLGINKIARDKYDSGKVWMSSYNQGMTCVDWNTKKIVKGFDVNPESQGIYDFVQLSKNRWLLATQKKLIEWDTHSGRIAETGLPVSDSLHLVTNIRRIIMAGDNMGYITTNKGLFKYDVTTREIIRITKNYMSDLSNNRLTYILLDGFYDNGMLWIASRNGLFSYNTVTGEINSYRGKGTNSDYFLFNITQGPNNQILCASGSSVDIFDKQTKTFKVINTIANLYRPGCENIICINNTVWIGTEIGILTYNLQSGTSERVEHENSMMQIYPSSSFIRINNEIVFGFRDGYAYFRPELKNNIAPSDPVIEKLYVNNQPVILPHVGQNYPGRLVFKHTENSINIAFTSFQYSDPEHIYFRYGLKGTDHDWQYTEDQRSANYAQLPPGSYTFYVQCGNKNGVWNPAITSVRFTINPPYWETWWFRGLVVLAIAFILYKLYRYKINHILAIERIRERIASDFHDDIGSALSSISIFSEVADKQLKQNSPPEQTREIISHISFYSRAMLDAMDDIIWAVNPQNDHVNDLAVRMREFAIPMLEARNIHFDIEIQDDILNSRVKMEARRNVFLVFKECINNILKHADCTAMKVSIKKVNNQMELVISDNGKGFNVDAKSNRNGLKNMRKRAAELGGKIDIKSQHGSGTITTLLVNII